MYYAHITYMGGGIAYAAGLRHMQTIPVIAFLI